MHARARARARARDQDARTRRYRAYNARGSLCIGNVIGARNDVTLRAKQKCNRHIIPDNLEAERVILELPSDQ